MNANVRFKLPGCLSPVSGHQTRVGCSPKAVKAQPAASAYAPTKSAFGALSRAARDAQGFALTLWDGLSAEERRKRQTDQDRKERLYGRMKNVCRIRWLLCYAFLPALVSHEC
jgi:hypothetical protein